MNHPFLHRDKPQRKWLPLLVLALGVLACNLPLRTVDPTPAGSIPATPTPFSPLPGDTPTQPSTAPLPTSSLNPTPTLIPTTPLPSLTIPYTAVFEPWACDFYVPPGYSPECGYLAVPENRARPDSPQVRLHVAVFRSLAQDPAPDPVVHLAGGPGSSALELAGYIFQQGAGAILEQRDLVLFDQRGTGNSIPRLDCPEREALTPALLDGSLADEEAEQAVVEAFRQCQERLAAAGIDLSAYNSAASAADVNDLRLALGYDQINLYGISYGTRLALTILRDHPQAVRSAVLDSAYPPEVHLYTSLAPNAERAFNTLFNACESDPACRAAYPDLRAVFYDLVDALNANPVPVNLTARGAEHRVSLDGDLLIDVLFVGLYNPPVTARMPKMIFDIRQGDYEILRERLRLYFDVSSALGMQMAVQCNEEIPFSQAVEAFAEAQDVQPQIAAFFPENVQPLFTACETWNPSPPDPVENQPVLSDVPTLVLAGEFDPITPPEWGRSVAGRLPWGSFYEFKANGHWVTRSSACSLEMALSFWEDPSNAVDSSCLQTLGGLDFMLP